MADITGTDGNDTLIGTDDDDTLEGRGGNDSLNGGRGDDDLDGGDGGDSLNGGLGADTLDGGAGVDTAFYQLSPLGVTIDLSATPDAEGYVRGTGGAIGDRLRNIENLWGSNYADRLTGDGNDNFLHGVGGNDRLTGGPGDDLIIGGPGADVLDGGTGKDMASYQFSAAGVTIDLAAAPDAEGYVRGTGGDAQGDRLKNIENLRGSAHRDRLTGDANDNLLAGDEGHDRLTGGPGADQFVFEAGSGHDVITDFELGVDSIRLREPGITFADLLIEANGGNARVSWSNAGQSITLNHITRTDLTESDFLFGDTPQPDADALTGTAGDDRLIGGPGDDEINGGGGRDDLYGGAGDDTLNGGAGSDDLYGGSGADTLNGGDGLDDLNGGSGADTLNGDAGNDWLYGDAGNDTLNGGPGDDWLFGDNYPSHGDDTLNGGAGNDTLDGGRGNDTLNGGPGDDRLFGDVGADTLDGGGGDDEAIYSGSPAGVTIDLSATPDAEGYVRGAGGEAEGDRLKNIENIRGSDYADRLTGDGNDNALEGRDGDDTLNGAGGDDRLTGDGFLDDGADRFVFDAGSGNDVITDFDPGVDMIEIRQAGVTFADLRIEANGGNARVSWGDAGQSITLTDVADTDLTESAFLFSGDTEPDTDTLTGTAGNDTLYGGPGDDTLNGGDGWDDLYGGPGADTLNGGNGWDDLYGGPGADVLDGGDGRDAAFYSDSPAGVTIDLSAPDAEGYVRGAGGDAEGDRLKNIEELRGSYYDDRLTGHRLYGLGGDDMLNGGAGWDDLYGGSGADVLNGGAGDDDLEGDDGADTLDGGGGRDDLYGGPGADTLDGGDGHDAAFYSDSPAGVTIDLSAPDADGYGRGAGGDAEGDRLKNIERLHGSNHADRLAGDGNDNWLYGLGGADTLTGGPGGDDLYGGPGADTLDGGDGNDKAFYSGSRAGVAIDLSAAPDAEGYVRAIGGDARGDRLKNIENIWGSDYDDRLTGDGNDNALEGAGGNDTLNGGPGADVLNGGRGADTASYLDSDAGVLVRLHDARSVKFGHAEGDTLTDIEHLIGSRHNDTLAGDGGDNRLEGRDGNDVLYGGPTGGDDMMYGGPGDDRLFGGRGDDTLVGGAGFDYLKGGSGNDELVAGEGMDIMYGGAGEDMFVFSPSDAGGAVIADFSDGEDVIDLTAFAGIDSMDDLDRVSHGNDVRIEVSGSDYLTTIILSDFDINNLDDSDFLF